MPQKCTLFFLTSILLTISAANVLAQTVATTAPAAAATTAPSAADAAFQPLQQDFRNLYESLQNQGGVGKEDRPAVEALRQRMAAFSKQFPDDARGPAAELYLSMWLDDQDRVDALYAKVLQSRPADLKTRLVYAKRLENQNRFAEVIETLSSATWDDANLIDAKLLWSNALFAEHRFQEAIDALNSIPESAWASNLPRKPEVTSALQQRTEYLTLWAAEQTLRQAEQSADDLPRVEIVTARGPIIVELFENEAPNTVANFLKLADTKFYDGTKFHRVIPVFMSQGGDPNSKTGASGTPGMGDPGYYVPDEVNRENARKHFSGSLAMAKTEAPDTGGCQFYITHLPTAWLNGKHTVFGRVLSGEDIVRSLKQDDVIETINIIRKREHPYEPTTIPLVMPAETVPATIPATTIPATTAPASTEPASTVPATQP